MKFHQVSYLLALAGVGVATSPVAEKDAVIDTVLTFMQSLDDKSESLLRSATAPNVMFDGSLFVDIGIGSPEPMVGQDQVALLLQALPMDTSHHLSNFRVTLDNNNKHANLTAYVQAYHYAPLEEPRENPNNIYLMGNRYAAGVSKIKGDWKMDYIKVFPVWQSGNIKVMGLEN